MGRWVVGDGRTAAGGFRAIAGGGGGQRTNDTCRKCCCREVGAGKSGDRGALDDGPLLARRWCSNHSSASFGGVDTLTDVDGRFAVNVRRMRRNIAEG